MCDGECGTGLSVERCVEGSDGLRVGGTDGEIGRAMEVGDVSWIFWGRQMVLRVLEMSSVIFAPTNL